MVDRNTSSQSMSKVLSSDFEPNEHAVVCGKGRAVTSRPGNKRFYMIVNNYLKEYTTARNRVQKTAIVENIVDKIKESCTDEDTAFVRRDTNTGRWMALSPDMCREKVGFTIRETLKRKDTVKHQARLQRERENRRARNATKKLKQQDSHEPEELISLTLPPPPPPPLPALKPVESLEAIKKWVQEESILQKMGMNENSYSSFEPDKCSSTTPSAPLPMDSLIEAFPSTPSLKPSESLADAVLSSFPPSLMRDGSSTWFNKRQGLSMVTTNEDTNFLRLQIEHV